MSVPASGKRVHITQDIWTESSRFLKKTRVLPERKMVLKQQVFPTGPHFIKHRKEKVLAAMGVARA